ncbi:sedoheptulokinase [Vermiculatibacterium agrestimuris]|uniref:sedoheptulokinase n=1 Tax=Vermiculatibacterium agrestimuris TaxID=2941519 RepID=UPI00203DE187|nr:FGGY family carbohydrate kinase [Vermiculatibacterium agrestimuris]
MDNIVITLDIGSTFIKAAVFDVAEEKILYTEKCHTPEKRPHPDPTVFENDAQALLKAVKETVRRCAKAHPDAGGLLMSTQQHGCVLCHPGLAADTYISWQDTRCLRTDPKTGKSYLEGLEELLPTSVMENTGVPVKPALALCNLYALFRGGDLDRGAETSVYTLGAYLIEKLTGNSICHITNAAPMGFANILEGTWRRDILARVGLDFFRLPRITRDLECCGVYRDGEVELKVYPDVGDVQTSVYGTNAKTGDMVVNIATSGQLLYLTDQYIPGTYEIRPYYDGNYCNVISRMPGGRNFDVQIDYLRDVGERIFGQSLSREAVWERIQALGSDWREDGGLTVDCSFYELPDRLAGGSIGGIDHVNLTLEHVIHATAKDFGRQYRRFAELLCDYARFSGSLYLTGGAILKNPILRQAVTEAMGAPHTVAASADEVYGGLFKLAKKCVYGRE